jgi:hypothetical protein
MERLMQPFGRRFLAAILSSRGLLILSAGTLVLGFTVLFGGVAELFNSGLLDRSGAIVADSEAARATVQAELVLRVWRGGLLFCLSGALLLASAVRGFLLLMRVMIRVLCQSRLATV